MGKKLGLPVIDPARDARDPAKKKHPSVDAARARLGGRVERSERSGAPPAFGPGAYVDARIADGSTVVAVVIFATEREAHVLLDGSRLRRVSHAALSARVGEPPGVLGQLATDARVFGMLVEGEAVRYADDGGEMRGGRLVEKCRYGALVLRDDGAVVAVGFRKLWPLPSAGDA